jgi:hypothetical protein
MNARPGLPRARTRRETASSLTPAKFEDYSGEKVKAPETNNPPRRKRAAEEQ